MLEFLTFMPYRKRVDKSEDSRISYSRSPPKRPWYVRVLPWLALAPKLELATTDACQILGSWLEP